MNDVLNFLGLSLGAACLLGCLNRLRQINWFTSRKLSVAMYLSGTLWALWIVHDSVVSELEWYQLGGLVFVLLFLWLSRWHWKHGVPPDVTKPGSLGPPQTRKFR